MSGFQGVLVVGLVLLVGTVFACVALSYSTVKESPTATNGEINGPEVADSQASDSHRQAVQVYATNQSSAPFYVGPPAGRAYQHYQGAHC